MWKRAGNLSNEKLNTFIKTETPDFRQLNIFTNMTCNCRCKMCHIWGETGCDITEKKDNIKNHLDFNSIRRFINEAIEVKRKFSVSITGGEPLLYKNFSELVQFLNNKKLPVLLQTNGALLSNVAELIVQNVTGVGISIDGPPEVHDSIRGKKNIFRDATEGIASLIRLKEMSKKIFPLIIINCALSEHSVEHLHEFVDVIRAKFEPLGVRFNFEHHKNFGPKDILINFEPLLYTNEEQGSKYTKEMKSLFRCDVTDTWRGFLADNLNIDIKKLKTDITKIYNENNVDTSNFVDLDEYFKNIHNVFGWTRCRAPLHSITVKQNGEAYFCVDLPDYSIGNIYESSFVDIWEGQRATRFRDVLKHRNLSMCNRCCMLFQEFDPKLLKHLRYLDSIPAHIYFSLKDRFFTKNL